ncbi:MAG TPA: transcription antitermination factor NusB [Acidiferrobacteraceae bacterium]|jgi:transcription antitermination protein NusB|nr:transcription antitermination factor NusB [Acidiferrobacteraceae bacterium]HEX19582.1 transcription antitermination factor NusB [Acidiferrobacteraceae bacterium]
MAKGNRHKARQAAVQALYQWQLTEQDPDQIEDHFILDHDVNDVDLEYFHSLIREIPLRLHELDDHIIPFLDRTIDDLDPVERAILRIGAYELEFHPEVPYKVVINEAVELAKTFGAEDGYKYINAVLDRTAEELRNSEVKS